MATALQADSRFNQILQCPICLDTFKRPNVLPCGHTYCASCLQSHISNKVTHRRTPQVCFPCPVCRTDTPLSDPNIRVEQWAESLPVNSIVSSILDISQRNAREFCQQCVKQGKQSLATYFCKDCDQSMCMTCKQYHDGFLSLSRHKIINVSESCLVIPNLSTIEVCPKHSGKRIKFFCGDHDVMCCNTCGFLEHRKCDQVILIEDMLKSFDSKRVSKEIEANLCMFQEHLKLITSMIKVNAETIQKDKVNILQIIHSLKTQLIATLQKLEENVIASLESNYKTQNLILETQESMGHSLLTAIDSDMAQLELVIIHGSDAQKAIMLHNLNQNQRRYLKAISEYQTCIKEVKIRLAVDNNFQAFVINMPEFGMIHLGCKDFDCSPSPDVCETNFKSVNMSGPIRTPIKERKAVKVSELNVEASGDTSVSHITDILHLTNSKILLIDFMNFKIKVFRQDYKCQMSMILQGCPWSACSLSHTEVAVTIPDQKTIQIFGISEKISKIREIKTRLRCWGIAIVKDQLAITTYEDEHSVLILNMNGKEIRTVRQNTYQTEKLLKPLYIKPDETNSAIYMSYEGGDKLVSYNTTWNVLFTYMNQDISNATGIDTDREGNIYLCGYISQCVQQISAEGKFIKTLLSKKTEKKSPLAISFYKDKDRFIVTYGACDTAEVYDLCV